MNHDISLTKREERSMKQKKGRLISHREKMQRKKREKAVSSMLGEGMGKETGELLNANSITV